MCQAETDEQLRGTPETSKNGQPWHHLRHASNLFTAGLYKYVLRWMGAWVGNGSLRWSGRAEGLAPMTKVNPWHHLA